MHILIVIYLRSAMMFTHLEKRTKNLFCRTEEPTQILMREFNKIVKNIINDFLKKLNY